MPANLGMRKLLREERRVVSKVVVGKSKLRPGDEWKKRWGSRALSPTFFTVQCTNLPRYLSGEARTFYSIKTVAI